MYMYMYKMYMVHYIPVNYLQFVNLYSNCIHVSSFTNQQCHCLSLIKRVRACFSCLQQSSHSHATLLLGEGGLHGQKALIAMMENLLN